MANLILTQKYLTEKGIVNDNTDMKVITPIIETVQDLLIHPILGTDLYEEILQQIEDSTAGKAGTGEAGDEVSAANIILLNNYIVPCLYWYTLCECTPAMKYRYMNKGIMIKNSENSSAADLTEIKYLMDRWKNYAETYAQRTTKFLLANLDDYPLYSQNNDCDDIQPNSTNYTGSIYLGDVAPDNDHNIRIGNYE